MRLFLTSYEQKKNLILIKNQVLFIVTTSLK